MQPILIATRCDACITLVGWCAQPLAYAWRAWVNATATRCRRAAYLCEEVCTREVWTGRGRVHALSTMGVDSAFCIPMPNAGAREGLSTVSTPYGYAPRGRDLLSPDKLLPWMSTTPCRRPPVSCESPSGRSAAGWSAVSSKARATPRRGGGGWRRPPSPRPCPTVRRSQLRLRGYQKPPRAPRVIGTGCGRQRRSARPWRGNGPDGGEARTERASLLNPTRTVRARA